MPLLLLFQNILPKSGYIIYTAHGGQKMKKMYPNSKIVILLVKKKINFWNKHFSI